MISGLIDRIRLLFVTEKKPFLELKEILGFYPRNIKLYRLALMHKSVAYFERERLREEAKLAKQQGKKDDAKSEKKKKKEFSRTLTLNNERLEFLGDAMLGAIVADILYKHYGNKQEGFLTSLRSKIVCRRSLNKLAVEIGLDKLILHTGAITTGHNSYINGNAFEAFVGAIYLDRGYEYCYKFMEEVVFKKYINIESVAKVDVNFKSMMIEWCQKHKYEFEFAHKESRDEENKATPVFKCIALIEGIKCGEGNGYSKKEAGQKAAQEAMKRVKVDKELLLGIENASERRSEPQTLMEKYE